MIALIFLTLALVFFLAASDLYSNGRYWIAGYTLFLSGFAFIKYLSYIQS